MTIFDEIQTVKVAAQMCGYSPSHVRLLADMGYIDAAKRGRVWLIYVPSLKSYAQSRRKNKHSFA